MKHKKNVKSLILTCAILGSTIPALALTQPDTQRQSRYSSVSQAVSAQQMAQQDAGQGHEVLDAGLAQINQLEAQVEQAQMSGNNHQVMSGETALNSAEEMYMNQLSSMTGVSIKDLEKMHTEGVSYGAMAMELGVQIHSGPVSNTQMMGNNGTQSNAGMSPRQHSQQGLTGAAGNAMMDSRASEIMGATARNTESGWAEGHGTGMQTNTGQHEGDGMMAGAGGLSNGMGTAGGEGGHGSEGMGGGMGASGSNSGGSGSGGSGGMGGSSSGGSGGGMGGSSGGSGGHGGGGGMM